MFDQCDAAGMREPGGAVRTMVPGEAEKGRNPGRAERLTGQGGVMGSGWRQTRASSLLG